MIQHGTQSRYRKGCRCVRCTEAHRLEQDKKRRIRMIRPIPASVVHGRTAYVNWGCRCDACRTDHAKYSREYRKAIKELTS